MMPKCPKTPQMPVSTKGNPEVLSKRDSKGGGAVIQTWSVADQLAKEKRKRANNH